MLATRLSRLETRLPVVLDRTTADAMVWACWPKQAGKVPTDVDGSVVPEVALAAGVVDVKVAALDATWSGLKLVRRLRERRAPGAVVGAPVAHGSLAP